jgi:hypothetical protein
LPDFFLTQYTKTGENTPNGRKIYQMGTEYTNLFNSKALHIDPNFWDFCFKNIPSGNTGGNANDAIKRSLAHV